METTGKEDVVAKANEMLTNINNFHEGCIQQKVEGLKEINQWNQTQKNNIILLKHFIESLFSRVETRLKISFVKVTKVLELFKTFILDESFYIKEKRVLDLLKGIRIADIHGKQSEQQSNGTKVQKPTNKGKRRNSKSQPETPTTPTMDVEHKDYTELDLCIESFETGRKQMIVRAQEMSKRIEKDILKDAFSKNFQDYEKSIEKIYELLGRMKNKVQLMTEKSDGMLKNFLSIYNDSIEKNKAQKRPKQDTYNALMLYTNHIEEIFNDIREMGRLTVDLWKKSTEVNSSRIEAIQKSFLKYFVILDEVYGKRAVSIYQESKNLFDSLQTNQLSSKIFSVEALLLTSESEMIRAALGQAPKTINDISEYFQELIVVGEECDKFRDYFVRKEYCVRIAKGGIFSKGKKKKLQEQLAQQEENVQGKKQYYPGRLVITVDALIILYGKKEKQQEKIKMEVYPEKCTLKATPEKDMLSMKVKKSGFFSRAKQKDVYFLNQTDLNDFLVNFEEVKTGSLR